MSFQRSAVKLKLHKFNKKGVLQLRIQIALLVVLALAVAGYLWQGPFNGSIEEPGPQIPGEGSQEPEDSEETARRLQEEWERRNQMLKEELGKYYVPLPTLDQPENPRVTVRAIYITGHTISHTRYPELRQLIEDTELNAMVIDVKDDHGRMTYHSEIEIVNEIGPFYKPVPITDIRATLEDLHERGIYTIARIVVFKDPYLARTVQEWAIQRNEGGTWTERGVAWINPYQQEVWDYNIAIAKEAALLGFREIQFDYIRFPENAARVDREAFYPGQGDQTKDDAIAGFVRRARQQLANYNVYVAHDVFGVIANSWADHDNIGQIWESFSPECDYICPMVYPSHYGRGYFGFPVPDANPAGTITMSLTDAVKRNAAIENPAIIRPWLQSFTASWVSGHIRYGAAEVRQQIDAALAIGIEEYMLWNAANIYPAGAFFTDEEAERRAGEIRKQRQEKGHDHLNRTAREAGEIYLQSVKLYQQTQQHRAWREAYALQHTGFTMDGDSYREWLRAANGRLKDWVITGTVRFGDSVIMELDVTLTLHGEEIALQGEKWQLVQENNVWRVKPSGKFLELLAGNDNGVKN